MIALLASIVVVTNIGFTAAYDTVRLCPAWVAYDLEPAKVVKADRKPIPFRYDARIPETGEVGQLYEVIGQYFDRGHLCPAADMNWDTNALKQTYLFSNIAPMRASVNRGAWRKTEDEVRRLAQSGTVHIVCFPIHSGNSRFMIPSAFVKVAYGDFGVRFWQVSNEEQGK